MADEQLDAFDVAAFAAATAAEQPGNRTRRSFQVMRRDDGAPCGPPGKMIRSADRICSADNMSQVRGFMTLGMARWRLILQRTFAPAAAVEP